MKIKGYILIIMLIILIPLLTGCWDNMEISDKSFVISIGIEKIVPPNKEDFMVDNYNIGFDPPKRYRISYEIPKYVINEDEQMSSSKKQPKQLIVVESESIYTATLKAQEKKETKLDFSHTKVILIGENVAKDEKMMNEVIDNFSRNPQFSPKMTVLVVKEVTPKEIIEFEPNDEPITGLYINTYYNGISETISTTVNIKLVELEKLIANNKGNYMLPQITIKDDELVIAGSGVFKNNILVGWLDNGETERVYSLMGKVELTQVTIKIKEDYLVEDIFNTSRKISFDFKKEKLTCNIDLFFEIRMAAHEYGSDIQLSDTKTVEMIEEETDKFIEFVKVKAVEKLQKDYNSDVMGIYIDLKKQNYPLWQMLEKDWDTIFQNIDFNITVDSKIRDIGMKM